MAKKDKLILKVDDTTSVSTTNKADKKAVQPNKKGKNNKGGKNQAKSMNFAQRIARTFREIISELKKVDWPPFQKTKNNPGVLQNTSTVLVVVLFFVVVITAFDAGLAALLKLLTEV